MEFENHFSNSNLFIEKREASRNFLVFRLSYDFHKKNMRSVIC